MTAVEVSPRVEQSVEVAIVDCDVHVVPVTRDELVARMPSAQQRAIGARRANANGKATYVLDARSKRLDSVPPTGGPPASDVDFLRKQLFGESGVDIAILIPEGRFTVDPAINAAWCHAQNEWMSETWLGPWNADGRFYGSISVSLDDPATAAREIHEWGEHPAFKQVIIGDVADRPLGFPEYEPIWAAAARHRLPVAMHFAGNPASVLGASPVGRYHHHVDYHSIAYPSIYAGHLVSWLCSGVFDRHPDLRVVFVEGGYLWHRPVVARLSRHWDDLKHDVAASDRDPLDVVREHVRFTTQPIEEAEDPREVATLMELADAAHTLMFSSDYPHYDFDEPRRALPRGLPADVRRRIMRENAIELYDLPGTRPAA